VSIFESTLEQARRYADADSLALISAAHDMLVTACASQARLIENSIAAAAIMADVEARAESVAACLLVDCPDPDFPIGTIQTELGDEIARLILGARKLRDSPYLSSQNKRGWSNKEHFELYHAFVASLEDPQCLLIELAHQLARLRNLSTLFSPEQRRVAYESLHIYAPLAHRLGVWRIKWELEDRSFRFTHPEPYYQIVAELDEHRASREEGIKRAVARLQAKLDDGGIRATVTGRPKHIYSIYRKMQRKGLPFEAIYDVRALRVVVEENGSEGQQAGRAGVDACYHVIGVIHDLWTPIPGQFDDYIAKPKVNGYQSLHTAVLDDEGKTLEVQVRTRWMDRTAEAGIAAHWRYKERQGSSPGSAKKRDQDTERAIESRIVALRSLLDYDREESPVHAEIASEVDADVIEPIFAFTPLGDVIRLPAGATPIDFAYRIHTELGNRCYSARVNGAIVPLNYQLSTGDRVEIITRKRGGPNINWLSLEQGFIRTREARKKISAWFRRQTREKNIARGHEILDRELARLGVKSSLSFDQVALLLRFKRADEMLAQIGAGDITPEKIRAAVLAERKPSKEELARAAEEELVPEKDESLTLIEKAGPEIVPAEQGLRVASTEGLLSRLARCCYPVPPEEIVGYVTRGHGVTIHLRDCPNVNSIQERGRLTPAEWGRVDNQLFPAMVVVEADNRRGLMGDIGAAVAKENTDISEATGKRTAQGAIFELLLEVHDSHQLGRVIQKLEQTKGVLRAYRKKG
jgi:RelA/SpoT family (p)ppGpp synthetase